MTVYLRTADVEFAVPAHSARVTVSGLTYHVDTSVETFAEAEQRAIFMAIKFLRLQGWVTGINTLSVSTHPQEGD